MATTILNGIKKRVSFGKIIGKKQRHDKNYFFFRNQILETNLIVDSRNLIKISKKMSL